MSGDELVIRVTGRIPNLSLNPYYTDLVKSSDNQEVAAYLKERIDRIVSTDL